MPPSMYPTTEPTRFPTFDPTNDPTLNPTRDPTNDPTSNPTMNPSDYPTTSPSVSPTKDGIVQTPSPTNARLDNGVIVMLAVNIDLQNEEAIASLVTNITMKLVSKQLDSNCDRYIKTTSDTVLNEIQVTIKVCDDSAEDIILQAIKDDDGYQNELDNLDADVISISPINAISEDTSTSADDTTNIDGFIIIIAVILPVLICCILTFCFIARAKHNLERKARADQDNMSSAVENDIGEGTSKNTGIILKLSAVKSLSMSTNEKQGYRAGDLIDTSNLDDHEVHRPPSIPSVATDSTSVTIGGGFESEYKQGDTEGFEKQDKRRNEVEEWLTNVVESPGYVKNFIVNGYDTISMVKAMSKQQDLREIGIESVEDQQQILNEIDKLKNIEIVPGATQGLDEDNDIGLWLQRVVGLPDYIENFIENGYDTMNMIKEIKNQNDLKEIGILSVEDQQHILMEIDKLKPEIIGITTPQGIVDEEIEDKIAHPATTKDVNL